MVNNNIKKNVALEQKIAELMKRESEQTEKFTKEHGELTKINKDLKTEIEALKSAASTTNQHLKRDSDEMDEKIKEISANSDGKVARVAQAPATTSTKPFSEMKLVHFDLKGAAPKIDYLIEVMKYSKKLGATGFLFEYEDTFPWKGSLKLLAAKHAYTPKDIELIIQTAAEEQMAVIPLIQTFGHLEFVLKHKKFSSLRENKEISNSVCPLNNRSVPLIKKMLDQIMAAHPNSVDSFRW